MNIPRPKIDYFIGYPLFKYLSFVCSTLTITYFTFISGTLSFDINIIVPTFIDT